MSEFAVDEIRCTQCPLWETSFKDHVRRSGVYGRGNGSLGLWLYGDNLAASDVNDGLPLTGDVGKILSDILQEINLPEKDLFITNVVRCRPLNDRKPKAAEITTCMEVHGKQDVPSTPPKLIVLMGQVPLKAILNKQKIKANRGVIFDSELFNCKAICTYHPSAIFYNKKTNIYDTLKADLLKAKEFILENTEPKPVRHKILINSKKSFLEWMDILSSPELSRACDIETNGLKYWENQIVSISFTTEMDGETYSIAFLVKVPGFSYDEWWCADLDDPEIKEKLQNVLIQPTDFFRGLFDVQFFWEKRIAVNFNCDVMCQHHQIDEDAPHNLGYCVSVYNRDDDGYKNKIAGLLGEEGYHHELPPATLLDYNIEDTYNTHYLKKVFTPLVKKEGQEEFFNRLIMPLERSLTRMSYRGIRMDREGIIDLSNKYRTKIQEKRQIIFDQVGRVFDYGGSSKEIKTVLFKDLDLPIVKRTEKNNPSSDKYVMEELARLHEVPKEILELRKLEYYLRMYLDGNYLPYKTENGKMEVRDPEPDSGMLCYLDKNDRIHGSFLSVGTNAGRPSCPKPNLLNVPKKNEIRRLFMAGPGCALIEGDYSQAELVALAHFAQDETFIVDLGSSDFHSATAKNLMKADTVTDEVRKAAKATNFLKSYEGGPQKLGNNLRMLEDARFWEQFKTTKTYDKVCQNFEAWHHKRKDGVPFKYKTVNPDRTQCYVCEAAYWLKKWDEIYPKVPEYKKKQMQLWKAQGYIMGIYGRKKHFHPVFNKTQEAFCDRISVNFPCQNAVSETVNRSIVDIDHMLDMFWTWTPDTVLKIPGIVLAVYDSIICESPDEFLGEIQELMNTLMGIPLPVLNIPLKIDFKISKRWGEADSKQEIIFEDEELEEAMLA